jgi:hypothetical protein
LVAAGTVKRLLRGGNERVAPGFDLIFYGKDEFEEFRHEERAAYPELFKGERVYSIEAAVGFMMAACELPYTQALMWVFRAQVQYVRSGLLDDCGRRLEFVFFQPV